MGGSAAARSCCLFLMFHAMSQRCRCLGTIDCITFSMVKGVRERMEAERSGRDLLTRFAMEYKNTPNSARAVPAAAVWPACQRSASNWRLSSDASRASVRRWTIRLLRRGRVKN